MDGTIIGRLRWTVRSGSVLLAVWGLVCLISVAVEAGTRQTTGTGIDGKVAYEDWSYSGWTRGCCLGLQVVLTGEMLGKVGKNHQRLP